MAWRGWAARVRCDSGAQAQGGVVNGLAGGGVEGWSLEGRSTSRQAGAPTGVPARHRRLVYGVSTPSIASQSACSVLASIHM